MTTAPIPEAATTARPNFARLAQERRWLMAMGVISAGFVTLAAALTLRGHPQTGDVAGAIFLAWAASLAWCFAAAVVWVLRLAKAGEERPLSRVTRQAAYDAMGEYLARMAPFLAVNTVIVWFDVVKQLVPLFGGFRMDGFFARFDYLLFLGHDPWRVTHALLGDPQTRFIDSIYKGWMLVLMLAPLAVAAFAGARLRAQFFLSWVLCWVLLGSVAAIALASAGPMFLDDMHLPGAAHYIGLLQANAAAPSAVYTEKYLFDLYSSGQSSIGSGISAAPSMHVAMAFLYVLAAWRWSKWLTPFAIAFFAVILLGSIHLGYHYAADGLISIVGVSLIWWGVGRWLDRHPAPVGVGF